MAVTLPPFSTTASITGSTLISNADEQLNKYMTDISNYMVNSFNSASTQISNEISSAVINNSVTTSKSTATFSPVANTWYRIATSNISIGSNSGIFVINWGASGTYGTTRFTAGHAYSYTLGTSIQQLEYSSYSTNGPSQVRIVYHTTFTNNYAYLEILMPVAITNLSVSVELQDAIGWSLLPPGTLGSVPTGYTSYTHTFVKLSSITPGAFPKITFNQEGRVTGGSTLLPADIPSIDASKITTGILPVSLGGTGINTSTGTGSIVKNTSPVLVTPNIGVAVGTSFNSITGLSSVLPIINGVATIGTSTAVAKADHIHPRDTTKASINQVSALALALGLTQTQINSILASNP